MAFKADFRLIITGTPLQNDLKELISVLSFVLPQFFLSPALTAFFSASRSDHLNQSDQISRARKMTSTYILRRSKQMVLADLPKKTNMNLYCELTDVQRKMYNEIYNEGQLKENDWMNVIMRLRKAALHPLLLKKYGYSLPYF